MTQTGSNKITLIHAKIVELIEARLSDYKRIPNPYSIEQNSKLILFKAYGVGIGPGSRVNLEYGCPTAAYERIYNIVLANQMSATAHDIERRAAIETGLIDDFVKVNNIFEKNVTLDGLAYDSAYADDSGIELLEAEQQRFVTLNVNFVVRYTENITL